MSNIIFALLHRVLIFDIVESVLDFVTDVELTYTDGSTRCSNTADLGKDLKNVTHINVLKEFVITSETQFCDIVDISGVGVVRLVGDMAKKFKDCKSFNSNTDSWDTSECTNMECLFFNCKKFNKAVNFDTAGVVSMRCMFSDCTSFNSPVTFTDTSNCTNMSSMFLQCIVFNQPLNFDTSKVYTLSCMLSNCHAFKQTLNFDTSSLVCYFGMRKYGLSLKHTL
jgi:hypothetical protein